MTRTRASYRALGAAIFAVTIAVGEVASAEPATPPPPAPTPVQVKLDINRATKGSLARLRGVGEESAQKIIDGRPYKSTDELVARKILTKEVYDAIAPLIITH
jgi:competence protein ComEA